MNEYVTRAVTLAPNAWVLRHRQKKNKEIEQLNLTQDPD